MLLDLVPKMKFHTKLCITMASHGNIIKIIVDSCIIWFHLDCIMQLKKSCYIATNVSGRKSVTTFGDLPDCWHHNQLINVSTETEHEFTIYSVWSLTSVPVHVIFPNPLDSQGKYNYEEKELQGFIWLFPRIQGAKQLNPCRALSHKQNKWSTHMQNHTCFNTLRPR